ncbi:MAG: ABC transporter ATP-binding protein [Thermomicrobiales bacterium]|nr:ABC transporter ATP-binding protein [Thermomicrobiales bacterium]
MDIIFRIFSYLKPYWKETILLYVTLAFALGLQLLTPYVLGRAIDDGVIARDTDFLLKAAGAIVVLTIFQGLFQYGRTYYSQSLAEKVGYDIRNEIFAHLQAMQFSFHDRSHTGQLMSRATEDINNIRAMLVMTMRPLVLAVGTLIAVTVILIRIDLLLALVALAMVPFLIWYSIRYGVALRPLFLKVQQQFGVMTSALQENVSGNRVVRAFAQEKAENQRFEAELEELFDRNFTAGKRWAFAYPLTLLFSGLSLAVVVWLGGHQVISGALSIGSLVAFNRYLTMLNEPVNWLGLVVNRISRAVASGERIFETLDTRPMIRDARNARKLEPMRGDLEFREASFQFRGANKPALEGISFTAPAGSVTAIVGPTGAGKSSLVNLIPRFYDTTIGTVLIDDFDVKEIQLRSLRSQIGMVLQETFLFSITLGENIAYGKPDATHEEIVAAAKAAKAHDFISRLPQGYDTEVGERGVSLSGGQKQRIAIARALLLNPRILILDDATSSVDTETEHEIQEALKVLMKGRTSIVIAQRILTVENADQILVLDQGRIVDRGTHAELVSREGFYRELYFLQQQEQDEARIAGIAAEAEGEA